MTGGVKIIAGLGNPGPQYENTPHSAGFEVVERIAEKIGIGWEEKKAFRCKWAKGTLAGFQAILVKPLTFMNLSGESIAEVVRYSNAGAADLLVIHDDIDLPLGKLRVKKGGSSGGHNGIKNIIERLGTRDFSRLKLGVGKERGNVIGHVLGKFDHTSRKIMDLVVEKASEAAAEILSGGCDKAMNLYNGWTAIPDEETK